MTTNYNVHRGIILKRGKVHTHESDQIEIAVQEVVRGIQRKARDQPNAPPSSIFRDEVARIKKPRSSGEPAREAGHNKKH